MVPGMSRHAKRPFWARHAVIVIPSSLLLLAGIGTAAAVAATSSTPVATSFYGCVAGDGSVSSLVQGTQPSCPSGSELAQWNGSVYVPDSSTPTPTPTLTPTPAPSSSAPGSYWQPPTKAEWQWEIGEALDTSSVTEMGTGVTAYNGDTAPATNPVIYDIDAIDNPASTVATLHADGFHAICYIEVGTAGNYYTAAQEGIPVTYYQQLSNAGDLGGSLSGYPEKFININNASSLSIIESMIQQQCAAKGFDAVETDLDETYGGNEGSTPWTITRATEVSYLESLAGYMHGLGLGWIAKNLDDTGDSSFTSALEPYAQGIISEQNRQYGTTSYLSPFMTDGKWIGDEEYGYSQAKYCALDNATSDMNGMKSPTGLTGARVPCA